MAIVISSASSDTIVIKKKGYCYYINSFLIVLLIFVQVNAVKFNEYASVVVSAGYDQSLRTWDCRSHSTEPIQVTSTPKNV